MKLFPVVAASIALLAGVATPGVAVPVPDSDCPLFPADNVWHADVSGLPVHSRSAAWIAAMGGPERRLHPDFGPASPGEQPYGIPYVVVDGSHPKVSMTFDYADESDPGPYPFGPDTPVEGGSDRHALMVDRQTCTLYELYAAVWHPAGPTAGSGAVWDLRSNRLRPGTWTSADAAGLPILAGLLRRDEVVAGEVDHAIRVTAARTDRSYLWPARHQAGAASDPNLPPMGARFRLRSDFDLSRFRPDTQVVLRAMQRHGLIVADNGSNWFFTGTSEPDWEPDLLDELKSIPAGAFEAVDSSSLMVDPDSGQVGGAPAAPSPAPPVTSPTTTTTRPAPTTTTTRATPTTTAAPTSTTAAPTTTAPPTTTSVPPTSAQTSAPPGPGSTVDPSPSAAPPSAAVRSWPVLAVALAVAMAITGAGCAFIISLLWRRRRQGD